MTTPDLEELRRLDEAAPTRVPVVGFPGYMIGDDGTVWSYRNWRGHEERQLTPFLDRSGYRRVRMENGGKTTARQVHRLVCEAFHGPCGNRQQQVRHLNGDKLDNRATNLAWGTAQENADDRERHGRTARGEATGTAKLSDADVLAARHLGERGVPIRLIASYLGVSDSTLIRAVGGAAWGHLKDLPWLLDEIARLTAAREAAEARVRELETALMPFVATLRRRSAVVLDAFELCVKIADVERAARALTRKGASDE